MPMYDAMDFGYPFNIGLAITLFIKETPDLSPSHSKVQMIIDHSVSLTAVLSFPYSSPDMNVRGQNRCDKDSLKTYVIYCIRNIWMVIKQIFINVLININIPCFFDKCSQAKRLKNCILYVVSQIRTKNYS